MDTLTPKQERFVQEYLVDCNGTRAAARAGYSPKSAGRAASRLLTRPAVAAALEAGRRALAEKTAITAERVMRELAYIGFSRVSDYVRVENGEVVPVDTAGMPEHMLAAVAALKQGPKGVEVRLWDKLSALDSIAKKLGLFAAGDEAAQARQMEALRVLFGEVGSAGEPWLSSGARKQGEPAAGEGRPGGGAPEPLRAAGGPGGQDAAHAE